MKTKEIVSYLHKQGVFLTEEQARDIAFIVGEGMPETVPVGEPNLSIPGKEAITQVVWEILEDNAFVGHDNPVDRSITLQELNMDSLDITRLVVEVGPRFGIELDTETTWPTNVAELVGQIHKQLKS